MGAGGFEPPTSSVSGKRSRSQRRRSEAFPQVRPHNCTDTRESVSVYLSVTRSQIAPKLRTTALLRSSIVLGLERSHNAGGPDPLLTRIAEAGERWGGPTVVSQFEFLGNRHRPVVR